ncbi:MAG: hypothetical protein ACKV2U_28725 [Bryobacteraceae bacterium]
MIRAGVCLAIFGQMLSAQTRPEPWPWSNIATVPSGRKITVQTSPPQKKIKGTLVSSDDAGITVRTAGGERTIAKANVSRVTTKRSIRRAVLVGAAAGVGVYAIFAPRTDFVPVGHLVFGGAFAGIGALAGWGLGVAGRTTIIYKVP